MLDLINEYGGNVKHVAIDGNHMYITGVLIMPVVQSVVAELNKSIRILQKYER